MKVIEKLTGKIVKRIMVLRKDKDRNLDRNLSLINPGSPLQKLKYDYYSSKISATIKISLGILLITGLLLVSSITGKTIVDNKIKRNGYGALGKTIDLELKAGEKELGDYSINIEARKYTKEEAGLLMDKCYEKVLQDMLGNNTSPDYITDSLNLMSSIEGLPVSLRWDSSNYNMIKESGILGEELPDEKGSQVTLRLYMSLQEESREYRIPIMIYPQVLSEAEENRNDIYNLLKENQNRTAANEYMELPEKYNDEVLEWNEKKQPVFLIILGMGIVCLIGVWIGMDKDLDKKYVERNEKLKLEYCEFVSKLSLLISSGMTIRGSFLKISQDYKEKQRKGEKKNVYEELILCTKKLQEGMREDEALDLFGRRCELGCYKKLVALLIQNLKKGNDGLVNALRVERELAFEERKAMAKRLGEESQTKLMFPMILMLGVVMIIIMVPAYMSFGI